MCKWCLQKKNCWEGDNGPYGREGGKKNPLFFSSSKRGHILMGGGVKFFLSHVPCSFLCFCFHTIYSISWGNTYIMKIDCFESHINILSLVIRFLKTFLGNYYLFYQLTTWKMYFVPIARGGEGVSEQLFMSPFLLSHLG